MLEPGKERHRDMLSDTFKARENGRNSSPGCCAARASSTDREERSQIHAGDPIVQLEGAEKEVGDLCWGGIECRAEEHCLPQHNTVLRSFRWTLPKRGTHCEAEALWLGLGPGCARTAWLQVASVELNGVEKE